MLKGFNNMAAFDGALVRKLTRYLPLGREELSVIGRLEAHRRFVAAGTELVREQQVGHHAFILEDGWACSYKLLPDCGWQCCSSRPGTARRVCGSSTMTMVTHQFADTTQETNAGFTTPLWIVGDNPFQDMQTKDDGYVVHLAQPRFIARWYVGDEPSADRQDLAEGLACVAHGIELREVVWHDQPIQARAWLIEACAAVAVQRVADDNEDQGLLSLTTEIVASFIGNNAIAIADLPAVIAAVFGTLRSLTQSEAEKPTDVPLPAVPIKKSIGTDFLVCLEDGRKVKMLKRYLASRYNLTPDQYRQRWDLPKTYPMVAPAYAARRSALAKQIGLGRKPAATAPSPAPAAAPAAPEPPRRAAGRGKRTS